MESRFVYRDVGFHGDKYLLAIVDSIIRSAEAFIETGTNVGSTVAYVARKYPQVQCFSCEPDPVAFRHAQQNTSGLPNVHLFNESSQQLLERIRQDYPHLLQQNVLFWLDAHGYGFEWPLRDEIAFITRQFKAACVLIDDFKVPGLNCFSYVIYQNQECSFEYIRDALNPRLEYVLCYPSYTEKTSQHHPLCGWVLIEFGHDSVLELPEFLQSNVQRLIITMNTEHKRDA